MRFESFSSSFTAGPIYRRRRVTENYFSFRLLRSPLHRRHLVGVEPSFSLTLTLSLGERGQPAPGRGFAESGLANSVTGMAQRRRTILPLPRGEGRGEGKENAPHPTVASVSRAGAIEARLYSGRAFAEL